MPAKKKTNRFSYSRQSVRSQMEETIGSTTIEYEVDEGKVFIIEHPVFYSKETRKALKAADDTDVDAIAQILLGDQFDAFLEAGGEVEEISMLMVSVQKDTTDVMNGRPTR